MNWLIFNPMQDIAMEFLHLLESMIYDAGNMTPQVTWLDRKTYFLFFLFWFHHLYLAIFREKKKVKNAGNRFFDWYLFSISFYILKNPEFLFQANRIATSITRWFVIWVIWSGLVDFRPRTCMLILLLSTAYQRYLLMN